MLQTARYLRNDTALSHKWKINNFCSSTPFCRPLCSKLPQKYVQTSYAQKLQFIGHIFVTDS